MEIEVKTFLCSLVMTQLIGNTLMIEPVQSEQITFEQKSVSKLESGICPSFPRCRDKSGQDDKSGSGS